jgi:thiamine biosynthesis protein ThiS
MITINRREINFENGMTVADVLRAVGEFADSMTIVVLDGSVLPHERLHNILLSDGALIRVMPIMSGG